MIRTAVVVSSVVAHLATFQYSTAVLVSHWCSQVFLIGMLLYCYVVVGVASFVTL